VKLGARGITIVVSLAAHGVLAMAALSVAHDKQRRRATTISLADDHKQKPEPPKPEPPKPEPPKPKPKARPANPAPTPAPTPAADPMPTAPAAPTPTDTVMSNEAGMDMGTGVRPRDEIKPRGAAPAKPRPAAAPVKGPIKTDHPDSAGTDSAGACNEPPGKPEPTLKTEIEYTEEARAAGIEGRLVLKVTVDASGAVTDVVVVGSVDPALDAAAVATVSTWRFKPALACGKPVDGGKYTIARRFVLGD
jgi:protein TonB